MLWFYLRCRGQPPRFFLRDDYNHLTQDQKDALDRAYKYIIIELLGETHPGSRTKSEPDGVRSSSYPVWKGFVFPKELKKKITDGLIGMLHYDGGIPSGLKITGYGNLP